MRGDLRIAAYGLALGYLLSWIGFTSYDELDAMFSLTDPRLWFAFGLAVVIAAVGFRLIPGTAPGKPLHRGVIPGSILFGLGWAITGVCPGAAFAQLGEGQLPALLSVAGIFAGSGVFVAVRSRFPGSVPGP